MQADAKVTWIGDIKWSAHLCQKHIDELWDKSHNLVSLGLADIILETSEELCEHQHEEIIDDFTNRNIDSVSNSPAG